MDWGQVLSYEFVATQRRAGHGGSWSARGFGFFGLEMTIPHDVNDGFVVYVPFYRLLGGSAGSAACNQANIGFMFMVHGMQDYLVESRQFVRLCDALSGRELLVLEVDVGQLDSLREVIQCGADSQLQLIREGPACTGCLCSGDAVAFASETVQASDDFSNGLAGGSKVPEPDDREINEYGGGAAGSGLLILLVLSALQRRHPRARAELDVYRTTHGLISANVSSILPQLEKW